MTILDVAFGGPASSAKINEIIGAVNQGALDIDALDALVNALPKGLVASAVGTAAQTGISAVTDLTGCSATFTASPGRYYKTTVFLPRLVQITTSSEQRLVLATGANATIRQTTHYCVASQAQHHNLVCIEAGLSGAQTRKARAQTLAGTCDTTAGFLPIIVVEDVGPV